MAVLTLLEQVIMLLLPNAIFGSNYGHGGVGIQANNAQAGGAGASGGGWLISMAAPFTNAPYPYSQPAQTAGSGGTGGPGKIIIFEFGT